ncbi:MAG: exodeoxyribonuclease VII small subunit [Gemmatimonadota bacterium]|nr:exodeoxyribonuclease VII small subunit [Gemmatimonadota bacterium]
MSLESDLNRLDAIVTELERIDLPLDRALELFEEGVACVRSASEGLADAEGRVQRLLEQTDGTFRLDPLGG